MDIPRVPFLVRDRRREADMRARFLVSLIAALSVLVAVGAASANSTVNYPDNTRSQALDLGGGRHAFVLFDIPGDNDIFVHPIDVFADLLLVSVNNTFTGYALWLDFEGFNGDLMQFGVYTCSGSSAGCAFGGRRGTLFL
jgi:hypothetical protein